MTWARMASKFFLRLILGFSCPITASQLQHVPLRQKSLLQQQFRSAQPLTTQAITQQPDKVWICDMYGVRSRLQTEKDLKLYQFSKQTNRIDNSGAQIFKEYHAVPQGLRAQNGRLMDLIRKTSDGRLIAELSLQRDMPITNMDSNETLSVWDTSRIVIAYSICR